ncbi:MAG: UvrB/UvrC motif-containing protein [Gallicola sp.]|nr:UvrB/UvrC motif-containing protein [Gallicola sp.]
MDDRKADILKNLPKSPGVYEMLDSSDRVVYVGKSVNLKNRVSSYFSKNPKWHKAKNMQPFIKNIRITKKDTDLEARYLECRKIHELQPFYNSQMKRSKRGVYLSFDHRREPLSISYEKAENRIGPLKNIHRLKGLINSLSCLYPISKERGEYRYSFYPIPRRTRKEELEGTRETLSNCFKDLEEYGKFIESLEKKMKEASAEFLYGRAAFYRDLIVELKYFEKEVHDFSRFIKKKYIFKVETEKGRKLFYIRHGLIEESCYLKGKRYEEILLEEGGIDQRLRLKLQAVVYHYINSCSKNQLEEIG